MKIVFKVEKLEDGKNNIDVLFANADTSCGNTALSTIIDSMNGLMTDEQKKNIKIMALYAGNFDFNDSPKSFSSHEYFTILVRLKNEIPDDIIRIDGDNNFYRWKDCAELLNDEQKDKTLEYRAFQVRGKIK